MRFNKLLILFLAFTIIFSVNVVFATSMDDNTTILCDVSENSDINSIDLTSSEPSFDNMLSDSSQSNLISENSEYVIYVDDSNTGSGNGSENNPFSNFDLACDDISSGKDNVIIKVFDGTYELESHLKFNTTNIHIIGLGDNVIIKNKYSYDANNYHQQAFGLISTEGNFKISNIRFEGLTWNPMTSPNENNFYNVFKGSGNKGSGNYNVTLDNCTFFEYSYVIPRGDANNPYWFIFNNCKFLSTHFKRGYDFRLGNNGQHNILFKKCIFNSDSGNYVAVRATKTVNAYEDCWFGINGIPDYFLYSGQLSGQFNSYAFFKISENYLGDNTYEIIGNLVRNGTSEIITGINPMSVTLKVDNGGQLDQTNAILENGTFKVLYTSTSSDNKVTATLDKQPASVEFKNVDISLDSPVITYGDKQNITVTLPESIYNGLVTVIVNGKPYTKEVEFGDAEITVDISDVLPVGTHDVNVTFVDKIDNPALPIYGFNTTKITVNKAIPNVNISLDGDLNPGEKLIIKVEIPYATEDVTIIVNGDKNTTKLVDNVATYTIDELVAGTYYVTVLYAGDSSLDFAYTTKPFDVVKSTADLINDLNSTIASQAEQISSLNGTVVAQNATIASQAEQISSLNGTVVAQNATIASQAEQISSLNGTVVAQNATIVAQQKQINDLKKTSGKDAVSKKATKITAPKKTFKAKTKTKKIKIKLTTGKTALKNKKVTLKVKGKTYTAKTNKKGIATFKITKLTKKGTFKYTVKFAGDKTYKAVSKNGNIKIK